MADVTDDVLVLERNSSGEYLEYDRLSLEGLKHSLPLVGDRLSLHIEEAGVAIAEVKTRYLARVIPENSSLSDSMMWVLIVEQIDAEDSFDLDDAVLAVRLVGRASNLPRSGSAPQQAEVLDRDNRDPAYWTHERKLMLQREREARLAAMQDKKS